MSGKGRWVLEVTRWPEGQSLGDGSEYWMRYRTRAEARAAIVSRVRAEESVGNRCTVVLRDVMTGKGTHEHGRVQQARAAVAKATQ